MMTEQTTSKSFSKRPAHTESGQGGGKASGSSEAAACRSCQTSKTVCDMVQPSCKRCCDEGIKCEYMGSRGAVSDDIFIVVMGPRGAGKSSFINRCVDSYVLPVGLGLAPRELPHLSQAQ